MFGLLYGAWQHWNQKPEFNILILGLDNAGKTTFLELAKSVAHISAKGDNPVLKLPKIHSTVGLNIGKIIFDDLILNFWDLGGQEELQCLWENYYQESHAIIYMVDASNPDRLKKSKIAFDKTVNNKLTDGLPILFISNYKDNPDCISFDEIENIFDFKQIFIKNYKPFHYSIISKPNGNDIRRCLDWLKVNVKNNIHLRPPNGLDV